MAASLVVEVIMALAILGAVLLFAVLGAITVSVGKKVATRYYL